MSNQDPALQIAPLINIFCSEDREGWRVYLRPTWLPRYLAQHFDEFDEAYPVYLDFEELERRMRKAGLEYDKRTSTRGDVELTAAGPAATELAAWLSTAFASYAEASHASAHALGNVCHGSQMQSACPRPIDF